MGGQTTPRERDFEVNKENQRLDSLVILRLRNTQLLLCFHVFSQKKGVTSLLWVRGQDTTGTTDTATHTHTHAPTCDQEACYLTLTRDSVPPP